MTVQNSDKGLFLTVFSHLTDWLEKSFDTLFSTSNYKLMMLAISSGSREVITGQCFVIGITLRGCAQEHFHYLLTPFYCLRSAFIHSIKFFPPLILHTQEEIRKITQIVATLRGI